jgi:hypothetical protein
VTKPLDATQHVDCMYSCDLCGIVDRVVHVPARGDEDVVKWVDGVMIAAIARDHAATSPTCNATNLTSVKVPVTGTDKIGGVNKQ